MVHSCKFSLRAPHLEPDVLTTSLLPSFVGAFDGIYEYQVNTLARRLFPSVTMQ